MNGPDRFWSKVDRRGPDECWPWMGLILNTGYGQIGWRGKGVSAHRLAYELLIGPIPEGLTIDHLCRVRACVNPAHMETVTRGENTLRSPIGISAVNARKTHCMRGHAFDEHNTKVRRTGRACRACLRLLDARYRARRQAAA